MCPYEILDFVVGELGKGLGDLSSGQISQLTAGLYWPKRVCLQIPSTFAVESQHKTTNPCALESLGPRTWKRHDLPRPSDVQGLADLYPLGLLVRAHFLTQLEVNETSKNQPPSISKHFYVIIILKRFCHSLTHSLAHSLTHSLTHSPSLSTCQFSSHSLLMSLPAFRFLFEDGKKQITTCHPYSGVSMSSHSFPRKCQNIHVFSRS